MLGAIDVFFYLYRNVEVFERIINSSLENPAQMLNMLFVGVKNLAISKNIYEAWGIIEEF